jgi:hypothetical protein
MSQNEESKVSTPENATVVVADASKEPAPKTSVTVLAEVVDALKASAPDVRKRLVTALTERELVKRVDLLDKGLAKLKELKKEADKIRPKKMFDADGKELPGTFTGDEVKNLKKAKENVTKLENVLEKAFAGQEFDKLAGLVAGKEMPAEEASE